MGTTLIFIGVIITLIAWGGNWYIQYFLIKRRNDILDRWLAECAADRRAAEKLAAEWEDRSIRISQQLFEVIAHFKAGGTVDELDRKELRKQRP